MKKFVRIHGLRDVLGTNNVKFSPVITHSRFS